MYSCSCTFFGEHDCPDSIEPILRETIIKLITRYGVTYFYVGNNGKFDLLATRILKELENYYYDIYISVTLAYFPDNDKDLYDRYTDYPFVFKTISEKHAVDYRNNYMLKNCEYVIAYLTKESGSTAKYINMAIKSKKKVINIADLIK